VDHPFDMMRAVVTRWVSAPVPELVDRLALQVERAWDRVRAVVTADVDAAGSELVDRQASAQARPGRRRELQRDLMGRV
jgi:hypothetical protein